MGFQFKPELAAKIMAGRKTQTRRPWKPADQRVYLLWRMASTTAVIRKTANGKFRVQWAVGGRYAIQPGRGKKGVGFLDITNIRHEDVRDISHEDALAEGFTNRMEFLQVWCSFYDPHVTIAQGVHGWHIETPTAVGLDLSEKEAVVCLMDQPADLYTAWVIDFKFVESEAVPS